MKQHMRAKSAVFFTLIVAVSFYFQNCSNDVGSSAWNKGAAQSETSSTNVPVTANSCTLDGVTVVASGNSPGFLIAYPARVSPPGVPCALTGQTRYCNAGVLSGTYPYATCSDTGALRCSFNGATILSNNSVDAYNTSMVPYGSVCSASSTYLKRTCNNGVLSGDSSFSFSTCAVSPPGNCVFNGQTVVSGSSVDAWNVSTVPFGVNCGSANSPSQYYFKRVCTNGTLSGDPSFSFASCTPGAAAPCTLSGQPIQNGQSIQAYRQPTPHTLYDGTCGAGLSRLCSNGTLGGDPSYSLLSCPAALGCSINVAGIPTSGTIVSGKCIFDLCDGTTSADCTNKVGTGHELDGRLPTAISNAQNLCKKYGADYDYYDMNRLTVHPSCGYYYGLSYPTNTSGGFTWTQDPLCLVTDTGFPVIGTVWCSVTTPANSYLPEAGVLPTLTKGYYNSVPFDADPHDNTDPRYTCTTGYSTLDKKCCPYGVDPATGHCAQPSSH